MDFDAFSHGFPTGLPQPPCVKGRPVGEGRERGEAGGSVSGKGTVGEAAQKKTSGRSRRSFEDR